MQAGMMDCVEFITMMAATDRKREGAAVLRHLEGGHLLDTPGWRLLVAEPTAALAGQQASGEITDDPHRLEVHAERARPPRRGLTQRTAGATAGGTFAPDERPSEK
jgi:hypothetical protein